MRWLEDDEVQLVRNLAQREGRCCGVEDRCLRCRMLDGVESLAQEVERRRWEMPVVQTVAPMTPDMRELVERARELVEALGVHTPMTAAAHAARSRLVDAIDEVERWDLPPKRDGRVN